MPALLQMAENLIGLTQPEIGRQFTGPNAPRTLGQQVLLQQGSTQRLFLDLQLEREAFKELLQRIWEADKRWLPKPIMFRVTEVDDEESMSIDDFEGNFDFEIGTPTSNANRSTMLNELINFYQLAMSNPLVLQNPAIIVALLRKIAEKLHQHDIAVLLPDMKDLKPPASAEEENVLMMQGQDVDPHPADNHMKHRTVHNSLADRLEAMEKSTPGFLAASGMAEVPARLRGHVAEHDAAEKSKGGSLNVGNLTQGQASQVPTAGPQSTPQGIGQGNIQGVLESLTQEGEQ